MKRFYIPSFLFLLTLGLAACDSNSLDSDAYRVTYTVTATGEATLTALSYRDGSGALRTVANPVLPWSQRVSMRAGHQASITVDGTVMSGRLQVAMQAINDDHVITLNSGCATGTDEVYPQTCDGVSIERALP